MAFSPQVQVVLLVTKFKSQAKVKSAYLPLLPHLCSAPLHFCSCSGVNSPFPALWTSQDPFGVYPFPLCSGLFCTKVRGEPERSTRNQDRFLVLVTISINQSIFMLSARRCRCRASIEKVQKFELEQSHGHRSSFVDPRLQSSPVLPCPPGVPPSVSPPACPLSEARCPVPGSFPVQIRRHPLAA